MIVAAAFVVTWGISLQDRLMSGDLDYSAYNKRSKPGSTEERFM
jgi:hypothetical protein